jgi:hypothetical protein
MKFWDRLVRRLRWRRRATPPNYAELARRRQQELLALRRFLDSPPLDPFSLTPVRNSPKRPFLPDLGVALLEPDDDRDHVDAVGAARH